jgi:MoaA/NifB/PqqE/SkfB family radical SAM enzyme
MTLATWHFHIEISSKCTLSCPRCARQEVPDTLVNTELDLEFFKRNFTPEFIINNVEKITFCGDDGDPIYSHDIIDVIKYIKSVKPVEIVIITNGSHKKTKFWTDLGSSLTEIDTVHFSIDGYDQNSNSKYRVNSDYNSIINGLAALRNTSECKIVWAAIAFEFNQNHLDYMEGQAKALRVDSFQLTRSTKFGKVYPIYGDQDQLQPRNELISKTERFEREITNYTGRHNIVSQINIELYERVKNKQDIKPLCTIGNKGLYISANGLLYPCCWVANRYSHNKEWQEISSKFNLYNRTLEDCLEDKFWDNEFQSFKWQECQTKCNAKVVDKNYATEW